MRHGETLANRKRVHQGPEEPLSDVGRAQSKNVASILKSYGVDALACSSLTRARETAEIISEELDLPHTIIDSVEEFRRPNYLYGQSHFSIDSLKYIWSLYWHRRDPNWDNDQAENLFLIRNRILNAQKAISELSGDRVAVVSHAIFIDMFTEMVCADRDLKLHEYIHGLLLAKKLPNTGIVAFDVDLNAPGGTCRWWHVSDSKNQNVDVSGGVDYRP